LEAPTQNSGTFARSARPSTKRKAGLRDPPLGATVNRRHPLVADRGAVETFSGDRYSVDLRFELTLEERK
jgi:hypothetical protein